MTRLQERLFIHHGCPAPVPEYKFHKTRKWRLDYAWPDKKIAMEIEGGVWIAGRHNRAPGFIKDMEKYNQLALYGWRLFRFQPGKIDYDMLKKAYYDLK